MSYETTEEQLNELFQKEGEVVSAKLITDKFSGRSRGFGFVEMSNDEEATAAIEKLNNLDLGGRKLVVNEARPMEKREPRGDFGGGRGGSRGGSRGGGGFGGGRGRFSLR
ncbi:MAG: RNA-binding protein [Deltaproteobacteria bacterium]|nr:RNA-binding protein [Deltaproteobacteria bacterium]